MNASPVLRMVRRCACSIVGLVALALPQWVAANGSDLPQQVVVQGFLKPEDGQAQLLVRIPLSLLAAYSLPKRGPGYLDLTNIDPRLRQIVAATGRQIELSSDGETIAPTLREMRIALPSDRSFASYALGLAHLQGPPLPANTDVFGSQGYFDVHFEYALPASHPGLWLRTNIAPELGLGDRIKLQLVYFPVGAPERSYEIVGKSGWIPLDPRWFDAAWFFAKLGFVDSFAVDRVVFLLCLIAPFRSLRGVLSLALVFAGLQAVSLSAAAGGAFADVEVGWLPWFANTAVAAAILLLAIGNLAVPDLRRRWLIAALTGATAGFVLGRLLTDAGPFAGAHPLVGAIAFNVGIILGTVVIAALLYSALRLLFSWILRPLFGVIVLSILVGHAAWHGMINNGSELGGLLARVPGVALWPALGTVALWLVPALLVGAVAYLVLKRWDGAPVLSLLRALQNRPAGRDGAAL